jgi:hypothetical protein
MCVCVFVLHQCVTVSLLVFLLPDLSQLIAASAAITKQERSSQNDEASKNQQQQ